MKRVALFLIVLFLAISTVYAGPYFTIEQEVLQPQAELTAGWSFAFQDVFGPLVTGDFYLKNDNIWAYPTPWIGGLKLGLDYDVIAFYGQSDVTTNPFPWPAYVELDNWTTSLKILGRFGVLSIWGTAEFTFNVIGGVGVWEFSPKIGLECRW